MPKYTQNLSVAIANTAGPLTYVQQLTIPLYNSKQDGHQVYS
jgi:hypothetical protein